MKFNVEKMKEIARPMTQEERQEIENRNENRDWLALSAKFALMVRHILRTEKMTQTELASRMGVSCVQVTKLLSGKENIGLQTIAKVEKALGRSLVVFMDGAEASVSETVRPTVNHVPYSSVSCGDAWCYLCQDNGDVSGENYSAIK
jgi:ribosome-binding protein aMBF1 (putative translation factor)